MCYEERFFKQWAAKKTPKRAETKPVIERAPPSGEMGTFSISISEMENVPISPAPETKKAREVERELETA